MSDNMIPPPDDSSVGTGSGGGGGAGSWVSSHKGVLIGGLVVLGVGGYFLLKGSSSSSGTTGTTTGSAIYEVPTGTGSTGSSGSSGSGSSLASFQQLIALEQQIAALTQSGGSTGGSASGSTPTSGTWLKNPLGGQPGGAAEQAAFQGTESYNGGYYNVYNLGALESKAGPSNWISLLYPGQNPNTAMQGVTISPHGNSVAVPVYSGQQNIPSAAVLSKAG